MKKDTHRDEEGCIEKRQGPSGNDPYSIKITTSSSAPISFLQEALHRIDFWPSLQFTVLNRSACTTYRGIIFESWSSARKLLLHQQTTRTNQSRLWDWPISGMTTRSYAHKSALSPTKTLSCEKIWRHWLWIWTKLSRNWRRWERKIFQESSN